MKVENELDRMLLKRVTFQEEEEEAKSKAGALERREQQDQERLQQDRSECLATSVCLRNVVETQVETVGSAVKLLYHN